MNGLRYIKLLGFDDSTRDGKYLSIRCSQCAACVVNGVPIHERGCINEVHECLGCSELISARVKYCADCR